MLGAIHNRSFETHPFYKDVADHGPFELQVDLNVKTNTFSLDEHHMDVSEVGLHHVDFLRCELMLMLDGFRGSRVVAEKPCLNLRRSH